MIARLKKPNPIVIKERIVFAPTNKEIAQETSSAGTTKVSIKSATGEVLYALRIKRTLKGEAGPAAYEKSSQNGSILKAVHNMFRSPMASLRLRSGL